MSRLVVCSIFSILFLGSTLTAGELSSRMVSTGWLRTNLNKEQIRIIDVRTVTKYYISHIPHSSYLNTESVRLSINGVPYLPVPYNAFASILGELGITENSTIIIYGGQDDPQTFYLIWLLDYIGHKDVALLEGGFEKWERENRPLTQDLPSIETVKYYSQSQIADNIRIDKKGILKAIQNNTATIIDVESPETFAGIDGHCKRKGHIKGAVNHFWKNDVEQLYQWKSFDFLKRSYGSDYQSGKKIILVCEDGWAAAHSYFTLRYILGETSVQLYDGGMGEWANSNDLPMETSNLDIQISGRIN